MNKDDNPNIPTTTDQDETLSQTPQLSEDDELLEANLNFNFEGFQVVRREFFAHLQEPSISFSNYKMTVNGACLKKFPNASFTQVLINDQTKILALRPCSEYARDSFQWCRDSKGKRIAKQISCKLFFAKIVSLLEWNPDYRYKLLGKIIHANGEYLIAFDLTAKETYRRVAADGSKLKTSRTPVFPLEWQDQFGMPLEEHRRSMQINIFNGFAIYSIKDENLLNNTSETQEEDHE